MTLPTRAAVLGASRRLDRSQPSILCRENPKSAATMEIDASQVQALPLIYQVVLALLTGCVVGGFAILTYVGIREACDAWTEWRIERLNREAWFAEEERIHRKSR
ncbi:MAG: hypothetical protein ACXWCK_31385 [Burkholderiales bacterium]